MAPAETRAPAQRRVAKRRAQQVVQRLVTGRQRRLAALQQLFEQRLLLQRIHQLQGRHLALVLDQAHQAAAQGNDLLYAGTGLPDIHIGNSLSLAAGGVGNKSRKPFSAQPPGT